jgi:hypothetical protein
MPSARDDFLLRQLTQVAAMMRRLREKLAGGASATEIIPEIRTAEGELFGPRAQLLRALDATSAARIIASSDTLKLWAELLRLESDAQRQAGNEAAANSIAGRAEQLGRLADSSS